MNRIVEHELHHIPAHTNECPNGHHHGGLHCDCDNYRPTHWLYGGGIQRAAFTPVPKPSTFGVFLPSDRDRVEVVALIGATKSIDRVMTKDEARVVYRDLVAEGWNASDNKEVGTIRQLRIAIHD